MGSTLTRLWNRLLFRWRRAELERDLEEEIAFHRELTQSDADMGNVTLAKEDCRDTWSFVRLERLIHDVRFALRLFVRTPGFTTVAVLSLAIGIGGNAAMFGLVDTLLVRPLPLHDPDRLVRVTGIYPRAGVAYFQQRSRTMEVAAVDPGSESTLNANSKAVRIFASNASANLFAVLGAFVARGRAFEPGEDSRGRDGLIIISDTLWKNIFAADPTVVGRVVQLNGVNRQIVGILPPDFSFPSSKVDAWVPMRLDSSNFLEYWGAGWTPLICRMRPGVGLPQAQGEVRSLVEQFKKTFPYPMARNWNADATAVPLQKDLMGDIRVKLLILLSSVGIVLLIACTNVASLLLSR